MLPQFPGWHTVRDALAAGVRETGCTVHLATLEMDAGPILAQKAVCVVPGDSEETLHERIKVVERVMYPATVAWALEELEAGREIAPPAEAIPGTEFHSGERAGVVTHTMAVAAADAVPAWRLATAPLRPLPDIMIVGTQCGGTTSMRKWLRRPSPGEGPRIRRGPLLRPQLRPGRALVPIAVPDAVPAPPAGRDVPVHALPSARADRAGHDLPAGTRFVVLLREPAERALSHYRLERALGRESKSFADALEAEDERLAGQEERVLRGERSRSHRWFSYRSRGVYAEQVSRWYDAVDPGRVKVVESERLFEDPAVAEDLLQWLGFPPMETPFPALNATPAPTPRTRRR